MFEQPSGGAQADAAVDQAWWPGHGPRLLLLARPAPDVGEALDRAIAAAGLKARLGRALFPQTLWHQSVSDRYADLAWVRARLLAAGGRV